MCIRDSLPPSLSPSLPPFPPLSTQGKLQGDRDARITAALDWHTFPLEISQQFPAANSMPISRSLVQTAGLAFDFAGEKRPAR
eukprot:2425546-Rhodomonas_salina.1